MKIFTSKIIYFFVLILAFNQSISDAHASAATSATAAGFKKYLSSPIGVIIVAGIATVYSGILYKGAAKQEKESKENIKKIDAMIASFKDSYSGYCPKGREDLTDAQCYCYTETGAKNTSRNNSQTCTALWAKDDYQLKANASNYDLTAYNADVAGCVTLAGDFDETCKCKKLVDAKGVNACQKGASIALSNDAFTTGFASTSGLKDLMQFSTNAANGNPRFDQMSEGALNANAVRARGILDQLTNQLEAKDKGVKVPRVNEDNVGKLANSLIGEKGIANAMRNNDSAMNLASSRTDNPATEGLLKQAQEKVGLDLLGNGKGLDNKAAKKSGMNLNFSSDSGNGQVIQDFPAGSAEKNYNYKNSDIVTDNKASIFEIISNRYVQSGLKRLFEEETK